jgi:ubiquinone/menaquinone biosynthesis C-methylase UbiE
MLPILFDDKVAPFYEPWFDTPEGRRADRLEKAALRQVLVALEPAGSLLEVGCGTGHYSRWLAEQGWRAIGLDHSPPMLAQARARSDLPTVLGDALALPFPNGAVDVVVLITVLEFLPADRAALVEAWRVARRGLLLGVLNRCSPIAWARRAERLLRPNIYNTARFYGPRELARLVRSTAGRPAAVTRTTTLWPRWLPLEGGPLPGGAFIALAACRETDTVN